MLRHDSEGAEMLRRRRAHAVTFLNEACPRAHCLANIIDMNQDRLCSSGASPSCLWRTARRGKR